MRGAVEPGLESFPAHRNGCINGDQDEKGPPEKLIKNAFAVNVGCDPTLSPSFRDEV